MDLALTPRLLDRDMIDRAFPLVRSLSPGITQERWLRFARPQITVRPADRPRGVMTVQNPGGYILGLFGFEVRDDLHENRTLMIDNIIVPNIPGREAIWTALADAAERLAQMNGCKAIRAVLADEHEFPDGHGWILEALGRAGYALEGVRASKRL